MLILKQKTLPRPISFWKKNYNIQRWSLVMNLSAAAEDAESRMLGAGEFGYSNDHLKKNMTMNFVLMYNGENKTLLSIRSWVTNLFTLSSSIYNPNAFKSLKIPTRKGKYFTFLLSYWYCGIHRDKRPDSPGPRSRPTTSQTYNYKLLRDLVFFLNRQSIIKHKNCFSKDLAVIEGKVT